MKFHCTCGAVYDGKWANTHSKDCPANATDLDEFVAKELALHFVEDEDLYTAWLPQAKVAVRAILKFHKDSINKRIIFEAQQSGYEEGRLDMLAEMNDRRRQREKDAIF